MLLKLLQGAVNTSYHGHGYPCAGSSAQIGLTAASVRQTGGIPSASGQRGDSHRNKMAKSDLHDFKVTQKANLPSASSAERQSGSAEGIFAADGSLNCRALHTGDAIRVMLVERVLVLIMLCSLRARVCAECNIPYIVQLVTILITQKSWSQYQEHQEDLPKRVPEKWFLPSCKNLIARLEISIFVADY